MMINKGRLLMLTLSCWVGLISAQDVKLNKKELIGMVNKETFIKYKENFVGTEKDTFIYGLNNGKELLFFKQQRYVDPSKVINPLESRRTNNGLVLYYELFFDGFDDVIEIDAVGLRGVIKILYQNNLIENDLLNKENVQKFLDRGSRKHRLRIKNITCK